MGGDPEAGAIDRSQHQMDDWEMLADALNQALGVKGIKCTDETRRAREDMDSEEYLSLSYYERWIASLETILVEKGFTTREEIDRKVAEIEVQWGEP
jgi:hypothetical protein